MFYRKLFETELSASYLTQRSPLSSAYGTWHIWQAMSPGCHRLKITTGSWNGHLYRMVTQAWSTNSWLIRTIEADIRPLNYRVHTAFWNTALDSPQKWFGLKGPVHTIDPVSCNPELTLSLTLNFSQTLSWPDFGLRLQEWFETVNALTSTPMQKMIKNFCSV